MTSFKYLLASIIRFTLSLPSPLKGEEPNIIPSPLEGEGKGEGVLSL
jgi:hypothetical protein